MAVKKELEVRTAGIRGHTIHWKNGGELPHVLKSAYTSKAEAQQAVTLFLATKKK